MKVKESSHFSLTIVIHMMCTVCFLKNVTVNLKVVNHEYTSLSNKSFAQLELKTVQRRTCLHLCRKTVPD